MMDTIVVAYFLINFIGAVWAILYSFTGKVRKEISETIVKQYDTLSSSGKKVTIWVFTFVMNQYRLSANTWPLLRCFQTTLGKPHFCVGK